MVFCLTLLQMFIVKPYVTLSIHIKVEDRRLKIDIGTVRDYLRLGELSEVKLVDTKNQLDDILTKSGDGACKLRAAIQGQLTV